jgi:hypothetical protein
MWEFDDSNQTTLPIATTTLVASQQDYSIPATALGVERVEVMNDSGDYQVLKQIDKSEIKNAAMTEFFETDGMPTYYDIMGNSIFLYPAPVTGDVTLALGLKIYLSRDIHEFAITDTASEPGIPDSFHPYIAFADASDYAIAKNMGAQRLQMLQAGMARYEGMISDFYARRNRDKHVRIKPSTISGI